MGAAVRGIFHTVSPVTSRRKGNCATWASTTNADRHDDSERALAEAGVTLKSHPELDYLLEPAAAAFSAARSALRMFLTA